MAKRITLGLLTSTMICGSGAAFAQPAAQPAAQSDDQEVIVTAQKRSENLQNVPMSIQALGTAQLQEQNVSNCPASPTRRCSRARPTSIYEASPRAATAITAARCQASASTWTSSR